MVSGDAGLQLLPVDRPEIPPAAAAAELNHPNNMDRYQEEIRALVSTGEYQLAANKKREMEVALAQLATRTADMGSPF